MIVNNIDRDLINSDFETIQSLLGIDGRYPDDSLDVESYYEPPMEADLSSDTLPFDLCLKVQSFAQAVNEVEYPYLADDLRDKWSKIVSTSYERVLSEGYSDEEVKLIEFLILLRGLLSEWMIYPDTDECRVDYLSTCYGNELYGMIFLFPTNEYVFIQGISKSLSASLLSYFFL